MKSVTGTLEAALNSVTDPSTLEPVVELNPTADGEKAATDADTEEAVIDGRTPVAVSVDGPDAATVQKELGDLRKELADSRAEAAESAEITKALRDERELEKAVTASNKWAILPGLTPTEFAVTLRKMREAAPDEAGTIEGLLSKAAIALAEAGVFKELGTDGSEATETTAWAKISEAADKLVEDGKADTFAKAVSIVSDAQPTLYRDYVAEQGA